MFRKILLKSGLLAVIGVAMIGMMSFAKPKDSVCFSAGAEGVMDATATAPTVQKAIEDASNRSIDAGVASVLERAGDASQISQSDIDSVDFWGYNNIGIAQVDNHLNVRQEPHESGKLVGKMSNNTACEILSITEDGRNYLKGWLANPVEKDELRYETLLKLFFGHEAGAEQTLAHIEAFEEKISKELPFLIGATEVLKKGISEDDTHKYYLLTAEFGVKTYQAYLEWCREAKVMLKEERR